MPVTIETQKTKTIILTSFRDGKNYDNVGHYKYSISRWQPKASKYQELRSLAPFYPDGRAIKGISPDQYRAAYEENVLSNPNVKRQIQAVLDLMAAGETAVLMCWCNLSRQEEYSKLFCHRILVGYYIEKNFPQIKVVYADGAQVPVWEKTTDGIT